MLVGIIEIKIEVRVGVFKDQPYLCRIVVMTETADPRIALMQKWSQENPALMAQAGLASSAETLNAGHSFIDATPAEQRAALLKFAGVNPSHHSPHVHPHAEHSGKKGKGKKGKGDLSNVPELVAAITKGVMESMKHGTAAHSKTHNKNKPFIGVPSMKLKTVYASSQGYYDKAVSDALTATDIISTKFPEIIRTPFFRAFQDLKQYRDSRQSTYDTVWEKILAAHTAYTQSIHSLKYVMHPPNKVPVERSDGVKSLLSKLMGLTIEALKAFTGDTGMRTKHGYYELKTQRRNITEAKKNNEEVHQAWVHMAAKEKKAMEKMTGAHNIPGHPAPPALSEFGADHGSFSMAHPYTP